jgi:PKD-like domain
MRQRWIFACFLTVVAVRAWGQANTNWVFGQRAWLQFQSSGPVAVSGAVMATQEGSATLSNPTGQLLLYTDGTKAWNATHNVVAGGSSLGGGGSSTQSAIIVPRPAGPAVKACTQYYIFAVSEMNQNGVPQTLSHAEYDVGSGTIVAGPTVLKSNVSEKLAAIPNSSNNAYWVVVKGFADPTTSVNGEYYVYRVSSGGVTLAHTIVVGTPHSVPWVASAGQMQFSPDGTRLAVAVNTKFVEILGFNRATGMIGPVVKTISATGTNSPFVKSSVYGLEWSPNSQYLYVTTLQAPSAIFQYDIQQNLWTPLKTSTNTGGYEFGQLQLGPDGKVYVAREFQTSLAVIDNPNLPGMLSLNNGNLSFVSLGSGTSRLGLPTTIEGTFSCCPAGMPAQPVIVPPLMDNMTCSKGAYSVASPQAGVTYTWSVTNGNAVPTVATSTNVTWTNAANPGTVSVTATMSNGCSATTKINVPSCPPPDPCCQNVRLRVDTNGHQITWSGTAGTIMPTLASNANPVRKVTATIVYASRAFSPASCGTGGVMPVSIAGAGTVSGVVPVIQPTNGTTATWNFGTGISLATATPFPITVQFPLGSNNSNCTEGLTLIIEFRFTGAECRTCSVVQQFNFNRGFSQ